MPTGTLRVSSYNVWNTNPQSGGDPRYRLFQYSTRMHHLGRVLQQMDAHVVALQEVRLDSGMAASCVAHPTACEWTVGPGGKRTARDPKPDPHVLGSTLYSAFPPQEADPDNAATDRFLDVDAGATAGEARGDSGASLMASPYAIETTTCADEMPDCWPYLPLAASAFWLGKHISTSTTGEYPQLQRNRRNSVRTSRRFADMVRGHPDEAHATATAEKGAEETDGDNSDGVNRMQYPVLESHAFRTMLRQPAAEVMHVASYLPGYSFVSHPAQLYADESRRRVPGETVVDEEGPAIFSRLPILESDHLLLSKDTEDDGDDHQRLCLHAVIDASSLRGNSDSPFLVDVYTAHLSLSERARNRTTPELLAYVRRSAKGRLQLLLGDMNAEPHEPAMRFIRDVNARIALEMERKGGEESEQSLPVMSDLWLETHAHDEPVPADSDPAVRYYGHTFPSHNPIKRIDIVYASTVHPAGSNDASASDVAERDMRPLPACTASRQDAEAADVCAARVFLMGQDPLPGTGRREDEEVAVGMSHRMSPVWASDHRAVVADFTLS
jgi:endonuclease/exonuclease/phosphatase family metal-dependent hydrolase